MKKTTSLLSTSNDSILFEALEGTPVATFVIDHNHVVVHWNHACELITGTPASEIVGTLDSWKPFYPFERPTMADLVLDQRTAEIPLYYKGKFHPSEIVKGAWEADDFFPHFPDGGKWLAFTAQKLHDKDGKVIGAIETLRDVTQQKRSEEETQKTLHLLNEVIDGCPVPMFVLNAEHEITHWNKACETTINNSSQDMVGTKNQWQPFYGHERPVLADLLISSETNKLADYYSGIWKKSPLVDDAWEATDHFPDLCSGPKWLYFTAAPLRDPDGSMIGAVETLQDISAQKQYESDLEHQAKHDALTKLPNRAFFADRLSQAIAQAERSAQHLAVMFIDLDDFKTINDTLGHQAGDVLLIEIADRIKQSIRAVDTVCRIGGDEFVVLLVNPDNEGHVAYVTQRIIEELARPITMGNSNHRARCSIGVSMYPQDGTRPSQLLMHADSAMYTAKARGKGGFVFFTQDINTETQNRLHVEQGLYEALAENHLELYYQPSFDLLTGRITGAEALLRWNHPERGVIEPDDFITIAEDIGLIVPIGDWVLKTALAEAQTWTSLTDQPVRVSVNVSARQFHGDEILNSVQRHLETYDGNNLQIDLEITENTVMFDPDNASALLHKLKDHGANLAMDDFGTGYSSLAYLRRFPFDMVKIDKSFVNDLGQNAEADAIVKAMLDLGSALGLRMVAEGVETEPQKAFLEREGCHEMQGFLLSMPLQVDDFRKMLRQNG
ncbi:EAL domain-containing protein [Magnetovibrio sp. PR-2]|uniref:sensor domain-containing protein n=1 Tax=Magnetovibrio sp. PR-2 TaxID=3120356 RepID=UPI002FCE0F9B